MRRGAIINKKRVIDTCIVKSSGYETELEVFNWRQIPNTGYSVDISGELLLRNTIVQGGNVLNNNLQKFTNITIYDYIGDNLQRNSYPVGILELHQKFHKTQSRNIQSYRTNYPISEFDISKTKRLRILSIQSPSNINTYSLKNAKKLQFLNISNHSFSILDITDNTSLIEINFGTFGALPERNINTILTNGSFYNDLIIIDLSRNKFTSFPNINAPNLKSLDVSVNFQLSSIDFAHYSKLERIYVYNCILTQLNMSSNTFIKHIDAGGEFNWSTRNNLTNQINVSNCLYLEFLDVRNCGVTALDVSNNVNIQTLRLGRFTINNNNNLGNNLVGIENLTALTFLDISQANILNLDLSNNTSLTTLTSFFNSSMNLIGLYNLTLLSSLNLTNSNMTIVNFDLDIFPQLISCVLNTNSNISGDIVTTSVKPNLTTLQIRETNINWFNVNHTPNLSTLVINNGLGLNQIDFTKLTKLTILNAFNTTTGNLTIIDLRNGTLNMSSLSLYQNQVITHVYLPPTQVTNLANIFSCNSLSTFVINNISRTNTSLFINNLALATLDTSFGATNCFPNLTELAVGGTNDTYTSTKVYDDRKNNLSTLVVLGTYFQVNGNLGTDVLNVATFMQINGDADLSYTGTGTFGATMLRVFIRPKVGSGLATDGNQIANLIIKLSTKTWTTSTANINIAGTNYTPKVIDLRGNCAVATPSTSLTTALALLTSKGVSVLRN